MGGDIFQEDPKWWNWGGLGIRFTGVYLMVDVLHPLESPDSAEQLIVCYVHVGLS